MTWVSSSEKRVIQNPFDSKMFSRQVKEESEKISVKITKGGKKTVIDSFRVRG